MKRVTVSVPGKLILMGEHAVVYGRPGLVTSLGLRLRVEMSATTEDRVEIGLPTLDFADTTDWESIDTYSRQRRRAWERRHLESDDDSTPRRNTGTRTPDDLVRVALGETTRALDVTDPPGLRIRIDSEIPIGAGFGSSAATAVGVATALTTLLGEGVDVPTIGSIALEVERRQHGTPSGIDAAAVLRGGLLHVQRVDDELACRPFASRPSLLERFAVHDSGAPHQTTGEMVAAVRRSRADRPRLVDRAFDDIEAATDELEHQLLADDPDDRAVADALGRAESALERLGVVPGSVRRTLREIESHGVAAKISGAGALTGDAAGSILLFGGDLPRASPAAWRRIDGALGGPGVRVEEER